METHQKAYTPPVSEMLAVAAQDVVTSSGFLEEENSLTSAHFGDFFKWGRWVFDARKGKWEWYRER